MTNHASFTNLKMKYRIPMCVAVQLENTATRARMWLPLPVTKERFAESLGRIGAARSDFTVADYGVVAPYISVYKLMRTPLANVNHLASRLNKLDSFDVMKLCAINNTDMYFDGVAKLIEFTYNTNDYTLLPGITDEEMLGEYHIGNPKQYVGGIPLKQHIDRREFGRKIAEAENGAFSPFGYVTAKNGWNNFRSTPRPVPESLNLKGSIGEDVYGNFDEKDYDYWMT